MDLQQVFFNSLYMLGIVFTLGTCAMIIQSNVNQYKINKIKTEEVKKALKSFNDILKK